MSSINDPLRSVSVVNRRLSEEQTETEDGLHIPGTSMSEFVAVLREQRGLHGRF
jgi:hypothetical protein